MVSYEIYYSAKSFLLPYEGKVNKSLLVNINQSHDLRKVQGIVWPKVGQSPP